MSIPPPTQKQARILWISVTALSISILLTLLGLLAWGLGWIVHLLSPILYPIAIAGIIAYLLDPMVDFFERRKVPRGRAIILVFIICIAGVLAVLAQVLPRMVYETKRLVDEIPTYTHTVRTNVTAWVSEKPMLLKWKERFLPTPRPATNQVNLSTNAAGATNVLATTAEGPIVPDEAIASETVEKILNMISKSVPLLADWLASQVKKVASWAGMIIGLALVPVFAFYLLFEKRGIQKAWHEYLPIQESKFKEELVFVLTNINNYLIAFFRGQVLVAMCIGALLTIGFLSIGLNYAVLLGILAGALSIVPYLGAILTIVPSVALAAVQFRDWWHPLLVILIFAIVQMLEGLVISPKIMGDRVGLHPMTIIIAVLVGTLLMGGIIGGILAIPLTAALRVLMFRYVWKKREAPAA